jgi:hypothetical protein
MYKIHTTELNNKSINLILLTNITNDLNTLQYFANNFTQRINNIPFDKNYVNNLETEIKNYKTETLNGINQIKKYHNDHKEKIKTCNDDIALINTCFDCYDDDTLFTKCCTNTTTC